MKNYLFLFLFSAFCFTACNSSNTDDDMMPASETLTDEDFFFSYKVDGVENMRTSYLIVADDMIDGQLSINLTAENSSDQLVIVVNNGWEKTPATFNDVFITNNGSVVTGGVLEITKIVIDSHIEGTFSAGSIITEGSFRLKHFDL